MCKSLTYVYFLHCFVFVYRNVYITDYRCTNDLHDASEVRDGRQSFPSGHASYSMFTAAYFCVSGLDFTFSKQTFDASLFRRS